MSQSGYLSPLGWAYSINGANSFASSSAFSLDQLTDVTLNAASKRQILSYDGTDWKNKEIEYVVEYADGITGSIAIGLSGYASTVACIAIGQSAGASGQNSIAIGKLAKSHGSNQISIGSSASNVSNVGIGNIGIGTQTLTNNSSGQALVALGFQSLMNNRTTSNSTGLGNATLTGCTGSQNTATGSFAHSATSSSCSNACSYGYSSHQNLDNGQQNSAYGAFSSKSLTSGGSCTSCGYGALSYATTQGDSCAFGANALGSVNLASAENCAFGSSSLVNLSTGTRHCMAGYYSGANLTTGNDCVGFGHNALSGCSGNLDFVVAIGSGSCQNMGAGSPGSVGIGFESLQNCTGVACTAVGYQALKNCVGGGQNVALGTSADVAGSTGSGCVILGVNASAVNNDTFVIRCGNSSQKEMVFTPVVDPTVRSLVTYFPFAIGITGYYLPLYR